MLGSDLLRQLRKFLRSGEKWGKIETESILNVACPVLAGVALPVRTVFAIDQSGFNKRCQVPPQRRAGNTVRTHRQLGVRWKNDERISLSEISLRIEAQKRVKDGKSTIL
ncbi:hypothetical protein N182_35720 [Sinorhizobium sp. GL2]|nr:hypothetical protein N182_35720 [Sinorhizobium sp. GL2]